jgi:hypothetical protein
MKRIALIALASCLLACQQETKNNNQTDDSVNTSIDSLTAAADTLTFQYDSVKVLSKINASLKRDIKDTAKAIIVYPFFNNKNIDQQAQVLKSDNPDAPAYNNYQEVVKDFIKNYDEFIKSMPANNYAWFKDVRISVVAQQKNYLGLKYIFSDYTGGAHPNTVIIFKNFHPATGKEITLKDFVKPVDQPKLVAIAEQIFRKNENLGPKEGLENKYFFDKGIFVLNDNFTITHEGLKFLYNSYEIKPYSDGTTELFIPFTAIKPLLIATPANM